MAGTPFTSTVRILRSAWIALILFALLCASSIGQNNVAPNESAAAPHFLRQIRSDADVDAARTSCQKLRDSFDPSGKAHDVVGERAAVCDKVLDTIAGKADPIPSMASQPLHALRVTTDARGRMVLTDPDRRNVHILDFENRKYTVIDGSKDERISVPLAVAADADSNVYISDSNRGMIEVFHSNGKFKQYIGNIHGEGAFQLPTSIAIDRPSGRIYLSDTGRHLVLILDRHGTELARIGKRGGGTGPGEFRMPTELALHDRELFVLDKQNKRIQIFSLEGRYKREIHSAELEFNSIRSMAVDLHGWIYLLLDLESIHVLDSKGELLFKFGRQGSGPGEFNRSQSIYIDSMNRLYVADTGNTRVQIFQIPQSTVPTEKTSASR